MSLLIGVLVGVGVYLLLQGTLIRVILGMLLLSNAANLIVWLAGGLATRYAPMIPPEGSVLNGQELDPLPQALILTAIVIGFSVIAFFVVLARETYKTRKTQHWKDLGGSDS
jgi:multicomponent Na+:H+ antiporter subunit C